MAWTIKGIRMSKDKRMDETDGMCAIGEASGREWGRREGKGEGGA